MKKIFSFTISGLFALSILSACNNNSEMNFAPIDNTSVSALNVSDIPEFSKRKLGINSSLPINSIGEQKKKQLKLHGYYFRSYSQGNNSYSASDTNEHMKMLRKAEQSIKISLDADNNGQITLNEINSFVTNDAYIKYFRSTYINYSFNKLDTEADKKLSVDEFNEFNKVIKAKELPDFQLLEEFSEYDYNSSRSLDLEEYEDFFMKYLLVKYGINR